MSRIIFIAPKSISDHKTTNSPFRLDYAYWNFYIPLLELGHQVIFFDSSKYGNDALRDLISKFNPSILFCIMTGDSNYTPDEPWQVVEEETKKGNILTFNWFCDDSWRFDNFSKNVCFKFNYCSTPELKFVENYKQIGYNNILYATWHANPNLYSIEKPKAHKVSFIGRINSSRLGYLNYLKSLGIDVHNPSDLAFEDMISCYNSSLSVLNFSKDSGGVCTQMKARMFEVPACGAALISEYTEDLENNFKIGEEIVCFKNQEELSDCFKKLSDPSYLKTVTINGYNRYMSDHISHARLSNLLNKIK